MSYRFRGGLSLAVLAQLTAIGVWPHLWPCRAAIVVLLRLLQLALTAAEQAVALRAALRRGAEALVPSHRGTTGLYAIRALLLGCNARLDIYVYNASHA